MLGVNSLNQLNTRGKYMTNYFPENCGYTKNSCGIIICQLSDCPCSVVYEKHGECIQKTEEKEVKNV